MAKRQPAPWRSKFAAASLSTLFVYYSLTFGLLMWLFSRSGANARPLTVTGAIFDGVFYGAFMTLFTYLGRRRFKKQTGGGDATKMVRFAQIIKSAEVPDDAATRDELAAYLPDALKRTKRLRILGVIEFAAFTLLGVGLAVSERSLLFAVFSLLFVGFMAYLYVTTSRSIENIIELQRTLDRR